MSIYWDSAIVALDGTVVVIVIVTAGALVTHYNILDKHGAESLGKVILNLLLPALLFTEMIKSLDIAKFDEFGILLFFCTGNFLYSSCSFRNRCRLGLGENFKG